MAENIHCRLHRQHYQEVAVKLSSTSELKEVSEEAKQSEEKGPLHWLESHQNIQTAIGLVQPACKPIDGLLISDVQLMEHRRVDAIRLQLLKSFPPRLFCKNNNSPTSVLKKEPQKQGLKSTCSWSVSNW